MTKTTKGCLWIGLPVLGLPTVLVAWGVLSFVFSSVLATQDVPSSGAIMTLRLVNVIFGLVGIVGIIMIPVGIVMGIITFTRQDPSIPTQPPAEPPAQPPVQPPQPPTAQTPS